MKKQIGALLLLLCLGLTACGSSMDAIMAQKPSVTGVVEQVYENSFLLYSETAEGYPYGSHWSISLSPENSDSYTDVAVGDELTVYYDGNVMETDPLQVGTVYAITLKTPADRTANEEP